MSDSNPLAGFGPDLEGGEQLPASDAAPEVLVASTNDYSQVIRELDGIQARIDRLRLSARFRDSSYA